MQQRQSRSVQHHKVPKKTAGSASASVGPPQPPSGFEKVKKEEVKLDKPVKRESPSPTVTSSTCITDDEKVEEAKRGLHASANENPPVSESDTDAGSVSRESDKEEEEERADADATTSANVEVLFERDQIEEKMETQQTGDSLLQTVSVVQDSATQVEGDGKTESEGVDDAMVKAAILSALEVGVEDDSGTYVEPVQSSDAAAPDGGGVGAVVHVVGDILGGEGGGGDPRPITDQSEPNSSTGIESGSSVDPTVVGTTPEPQVPNPTNLDQTSQTSSPTESPSSPTASASAVPCTAVKTGRSKRQLAASFVRNTNS